MQIDWWTLALQAVNFLVLVWLLWRFLYRPVRDVIEKRKVLAEEAFVDAEKRKTEAEAARRQFEDARAGLDKERQDMQNRVHQELEDQRDKMLAEAKAEAERIVASAREAIDAERAAAVKELRDDAVTLASDLASELLRKTGAGVPGDVFLAQVEHHLKALPADERKRLSDGLAAEGARLTIVTALELVPEDRDRWAARISDCLGRKDGIVFDTDPDLLGGAELRFPHAVLKFTWADQLRKAGEVLRNDEAAS